MNGKWLKNDTNKLSKLKTDFVQNVLKSHRPSDQIGFAWSASGFGEIR